MKKLVFFLFLIIISQTVYSQENIFINKQKLDSLQNLINRNQLEDTTKVKHLNYMARIYFSNFEYLEGLKNAKQAKILADKLKYNKGDGLYYRTMFEFSYSSIIRDYLNTKANLAFSENQQSEYNFELVYQRLTSGLEEKANYELDKSQTFFEKDKELSAYILIERNNFLQQNNHAAMIANYDKAINLFTEVNLIGESNSVKILKMNGLLSFGKLSEANKIEEELSKYIIEMANSDESIYFLIHLLNYQNQVGTAYAFQQNLKLETKIDESGNKKLHVHVLQNLAQNFAFLDMSEKAVEYYKRAISIREEIDYNYNDIRIYFNIGFDLVSIKKFEEAKKYFSKAKDLTDKNTNQIVRQANLERYKDAIGQILMGQEKYLEALDMFNQSKRQNFWTNFYQANCHYKLGNLNESVNLGTRSYNEALAYGRDQRTLLKICLLLSEVHNQLGQTDKSFEYLKKYRDIIEKQKIQDLANNTSDFEIQKIIDASNAEKIRLEQEKLLKVQQNKIQRVWIFSITGALLSALLVAFILYRNNKNKQKANAQLKSQKEKVENTLQQLKSTQSQLIQSEKMASLGELTAGIAHEIQNPLNFVNNFSEVSIDLMDEMDEELANGNDEEVKAIKEDLRQNLEKINHHGNRASSIVKGMLQHSRTSTGQKEPTDINALADEYLRLAYHGLRAKDKSFNAEFVTDFDPNLPKINIIPQDIGRVLLNLINNAFYAVSERTKLLTPPPPKGGIEERGKDYVPTVTISTAFQNPPPAGGGRGVRVVVKDNGPGIPIHIVDKIFQPFFTTKPTGQGTGLGLSLSYDIVKAHGGELKVDNKPGEGVTFIIILPIV